MYSYDIEYTIDKAYNNINESNFKACAYLTYAVVVASVKIVNSLLIAPAALVTSTFKDKPFDKTFNEYKITDSDTTKSVANGIWIFSSLSIGVLAIPLFAGLCSAALLIHSVEQKCTSTDYGISLLRYLGDTDSWPHHEKIEIFFKKNTFDPDQGESE